MDAAIQLRKRAVEVSRERPAATFVVLEALFFDELQPELHGTPGSKFKRDVSVRKPAAAATSLGGDAHRASLCDPLLGCERDTVEASLNSAPVAFDGEIGKVSGANLSSTP
ncbi:MAG: hypothetical protein V9H26_05465 [Verrucomicrobiota bacterium]